MPRLPFLRRYPLPSNPLVLSLFLPSQFPKRTYPIGRCRFGHSGTNSCSGFSLTPILQHSWVQIEVKAGERSPMMCVCDGSHQTVSGEVFQLEVLLDGGERWFALESSLCCCCFSSLPLDSNLTSIFQPKQTGLRRSSVGPMSLSL